MHLAVRWGVPQWPFPQLLHPTFKFRLIRLERAAQSVTFHQVSPDTLQLGGIPQHWPLTLSWGNSPLLWLIWSKCYLIKLWDSDSEQMDISPIGWPHLGPLIVKNLKQPCHFELVWAKKQYQIEKNGLSMASRIMRPVCQHLRPRPSWKKTTSRRSRGRKRAVESSIFWLVCALWKWLGVWMPMTLGGAVRLMR